MYKNRNTGYVPMLLSSNDVDDFLSRLTTMKSVAQYDTDLIKEMKETKRIWTYSSAVKRSKDFLRWSYEKLQLQGSWAYGYYSWSKRFNFSYTTWAKA